MLRDINPGKVGSQARDFTYCNGFVYFAADDGTHGFELWRTDGTADGTIMIKDINTSFMATGKPIGSVPRYLCDVNGILYFAVSTDPTSGEEALWKTDGTAAGTVLVNNQSFSFPSNLTQLTSFNGALYFSETIITPNLYRVTSSGPVAVKSGS